MKKKNQKKQLEKILIDCEKVFRKNVFCKPTLELKNDFMIFKWRILNDTNTHIEKRIKKAKDSVSLYEIELQLRQANDSTNSYHLPREQHAKRYKKLEKILISCEQVLAANNAYEDVQKLIDSFTLFKISMLSGEKTRLKKRIKIARKVTKKYMIELDFVTSLNLPN